MDAEVHSEVRLAMIRQTEMSLLIMILKLVNTSSNTFPDISTQYEDALKKRKLKL